MRTTKTNNYYGKKDDKNDETEEGTTNSKSYVW